MRAVPGIISVDRVERGQVTGAPGGLEWRQLRASEDGWRRRPIWEAASDT